MPTSPRLPSGFLPLALLCLAPTGAAAWLRHGFVESEALTLQCLEPAAPVWCGWREPVDRVLGGPELCALAVVLAVVGLGLGRGRWAALAMVCGAVALAFGSAALGGLGLVLGLLGRVRAQARPGEASIGPAISRATATQAQASATSPPP